ncbi:udp-sugar pyrophospharylase-like protein [Chrysochromulina tobinii]|uniref:UTP-monosaccharide-1-phosphate uridylyltransferase n=1 Tax=Chrysochromulina tobinii TaxID=1460289 RepID=A0A0M0JD31_9EUKA|nr:udp-sugar pyrophospharylase-like protein [Chrysochromulina tobinii]|eukprot:KOO24474.1 udp-sugar pyrophospharylase-like protein [Chrysochromulina sp. CCMP291]
MAKGTVQAGTAQSLLDVAELSLANALLGCGQAHLFEKWAEPGTDDAEKHVFFDQLASLDAAYPGGLSAYVVTARRLLAASAKGDNPLQGWTPALPPADAGTSLDPTSAESFAMEARGLEEAVRLGFVVVAGGVGERLGYSGIKLSLPCEIVSGIPVLQHYCAHIVSLQSLLTERLGRAVRLPLAIMTSHETHARTQQMLQANHYFGLAPSQVTLLLQKNVAALADASAKLALEPGSPYRVQTKPHGHGDVHALLHATGLAARWAREGVSWLFFLQDSSTLYFSHYIASLGVGASRGLEVTFVATPRKAKMALGMLATMVHESGTTRPIVPVEYNEIEPLLAKSSAAGAKGGAANGDVNQPNGYSAYPGNTNGILLAMAPYLEVLKATRGQVDEFVNPKYTDHSRTVFKSSTRLECLMQNVAWMYPAAAPIGYVIYPPTYGYFPAKNDLATAAALSAKGVPPYAAATAEFAIYNAHAATLRAFGATVPLPVDRSFQGVLAPLGPAVVLHPSVAPCFSELRARLPSPELIRVSDRSTLLLSGRRVAILALQLDGALDISVCDAATLVVHSLAIVNEGWQFDELAPTVISAKECPDVLRMRGYTLRKRGCSSNAVTLAPRAFIHLPLVLASPSVATVDIRPSTTGLLLTLLAEAGEGGPVLPPVPLPCVLADAPAETIELAVPGSGVYALELRNTNFLSLVAFSAKVEHEPVAERHRVAMLQELSARRLELERVAQQEAELLQSEEALARRLWEVQETRRRHQVIQQQLSEEVASVELALAKPEQRISAEYRQPKPRGSMEEKGSSK